MHRVKMFRAPVSPSAYRPASFEWPERWKQQVVKSIGPGAGAREIEAAKLMGSALMHMQKKDLPSINSSSAKR